MKINVFQTHVMSQVNLTNLPLEVLHLILLKCTVSDVISVSRALLRPSLQDILLKTFLWPQCEIGPRMMETSLQYLGGHVKKLTITGKLKFGKNSAPKKEKFFKSSELLPKFVLSYIKTNCQEIEVLILDKCVLGPHINTVVFPKHLKKFVIRSTIFVKKSSFFSNIWVNLPNLKELRIENIQNFDKTDCYAVLSSLNIDFDVKFENHETSPSFIFYKN